jgi:hypothetical protein
VSQQAVAILVTFADDRVERWTAVDKRMVVEHWFPAAAYPAGDKVLGIADRVPPTDCAVTPARSSSSSSREGPWTKSAPPVSMSFP